MREDVRTIEHLSPAELQVAVVVGRGASTKEAAAELFLSPKTVDHHLGRIYSKLGLRSRTESSRGTWRSSMERRGNPTSWSRTPLRDPLRGNIACRSRHAG